MKGLLGFRGHWRNTKRVLPALATRAAGGLCKSTVELMESQSHECNESDGFSSCASRLLGRISVQVGCTSIASAHFFRFCGLRDLDCFSDPDLFKKPRFIESNGRSNKIYATRGSCVLSRCWSEKLISPNAEICQIESKRLASTITSTRFVNGGSRSERARAPRSYHQPAHNVHRQLRQLDSRNPLRYAFRQFTLT